MSHILIGHQNEWVLVVNGTLRKNFSGKKLNQPIVYAETYIKAIYCVIRVFQANSLPYTSSLSLQAHLGDVHEIVTVDGLSRTRHESLLNLVSWLLCVVTHPYGWIKKPCLVVDRALPFSTKPRSKWSRTGQRLLTIVPYATTWTTLNFM